MTWNEERLELLQELHARGLTASVIALEISRLPPVTKRVSRSAVIGKIHRMGLARGFARRVGGAYVKKIRNKRKAAKLQEQKASLRKPKRSRLLNLPTEPLPPPSETDIPRLSLWELNDLPAVPRHCRWPCADTSNVDADTKLYCGEETVAGTSYCLNHFRRAYQPPTVNRRVTEPESRRQREPNEELV